MEAHAASATLTIKEAARYLGIGRETAYSLARQGKLPGVRRLGYRFVVSRRALEDYLKDGFQTTQAHD